jgi:DNA-directed RNA polymerase subunit K/omega
MSKTKVLNTRTATSNMPNSIITRDSYQIAEPTNNIYQSLNIISARARQVSDNMKADLQEKLGEFSSQIDNLEEVHENREQIEISKFFERLPKPFIIATEEFLHGKVFFRDRKALDETIANR